MTSISWARPEVYFSPGEVQSHLVAAIDRTNHTLDIAIYELSSKPVWNALQHAGERGVQIRLIMDEEALQEHPQDKRMAGLLHATLEALKGPGRRQGAMHHKFAIFDGNQVVTGSYNWSQGAEYANYENALFEDDPRIVRAFRIQFAELWVHAHPVHSLSGGARPKTRHHSRRRKSTV